jgi:hypothetical protein
MGGLQFKASQGKQQDPITTSKKLDLVVHACHPSYTGSTNRRIPVQANWGIKARPYLKNN